MLRCARREPFGDLSSNVGSVSAIRSYFAKNGMTSAWPTRHGSRAARRPARDVGAVRSITIGQFPSSNLPGGRLSAPFSIQTRLTRPHISMQQGFPASPHPPVVSCRIGPAPASLRFSFSPRPSRFLPMTALVTTFKSAPLDMNARDGSSPISHGHHTKARASSAERRGYFCLVCARDGC